MEPKEATRRRAAARADKDEIGPSERMRFLNPHVEETGEVVGYILFSRWKDLCLACGKQELEG